LLSTVVGVTVFLVLLLFAVQLAFNLYATSAINAVAFDAARDVAGSSGGASATAQAEARARAILDRFETAGGRVTFRWNTARDDVVELEVVAERPSLLARMHVPFQRVARTVRVRWERAR
jgi:hypothetical protein